MFYSSIDLTGNGTRAAATAATVAITATTPTPIIMDLSNETDENDDKKANDLSPMDFAANIEKVKEVRVEFSFMHSTIKCVE